LRQLGFFLFSCQIVRRAELPFAASGSIFFQKYFSNLAQCFGSGRFAAFFVTQQKFTNNEIFLRQLPFFFLVILVTYNCGVFAACEVLSMSSGLFCYDATVTNYSVFYLQNALPISFFYCI